MNKIDNIIQPSSQYEYSMCVTYDIGKVTLRKVIEEEKNGIVVDKYPKFSGKTYFIGGNHMDTYFKNGGSDMGNAISKIRNDLENLLKQV